MTCGYKIITMFHWVHRRKGPTDVHVKGAVSASLLFLFTLGDAINLPPQKKQKKQKLTK